jgi:acetyl esterase
MSILFKLFQKQWNKTEKKDAQRIASQEPVQGIEEVTDIAYIDDGLRGHLLDVYFPRKAQDKKLPVVIDIHGGGWMYGYKELNKNYNLYLSSSGYTVFSLSYRLAPEVFMPDQIKDIFAALKWIDEHMDEFPCDRNNVYLTGDSAGGQLAGYTAVIYNNPVLEKAFCVSGAGFKFNAVALICSPREFICCCVISSPICLSAFARETHSFRHVENLKLSENIYCISSLAYRAEKGDI